MNKKDFEKIKYPIHLLKKGESVFDLGDLQPLKNVFSIQTDAEALFDLDPEFVMKYIILMYSVGSPAIEKFKNLGKRKTWVLSQLGVEPNSEGRYEDRINYLTLNKIPQVVRKINVFRTLQQPQDFAIMEHAFEEMDRLLKMSGESDGGEEDGEVAEPMTIDDHIKQRKLIEETRKQYEAAKVRFMNLEKEIIQATDIDHFMAQNGLGIRLEEILMYLPAPKMPKHQKADTIHPDVRKN